jgi:hypothetical protein
MLVDAFTLNVRLNSLESKFGGLNLRKWESVDLPFWQLGKGHVKNRHELSKKAVEWLASVSICGSPIGQVIFVNKPRC